MDSFERKDRKRMQESRDKWKEKAMSRHNQIRKLRSKIRDLTESRSMWQKRYDSLRIEVEQNSSKEQEPSSPDIEEQKFYCIIVCLCIRLTVDCMVSFRAIPKILSAFGKVFQSLGMPFQLKIPHFTTTINWNLKVGCYLLKKASEAATGHWICIIDHTIQVGTNKAFVVLKVPIENVSSSRALTLKDVEVICIRIQKKCNGTIVKNILDELFGIVGFPLQIVLDGGPDLNKGVHLVANEMLSPFKITYDLTHLIATLLKKKYTSHTIFNKMLSLMTQTKNKVRQTILSFLIPLKERSKSRFLNLPSIAKWTKQVLIYFERLSDETPDDEQFALMMPHFSWLFEYQNFLTDFWVEMQALTDIQKLLKNMGVNEFTYQKASRVLEQIIDPDIRIPLSEHLRTEYEFAKNVSFQVLQSSDIIESLFGKYKNIAKPHSLSEINRMILTLPCITEDITPELIEEAFNHTKTDDLKKWIKEEISETLLSKRRTALGNNMIKNKTTAQLINFPKNNSSDDHFIHGQKTVGALCAFG